MNYTLCVTLAKISQVETLRPRVDMFSFGQKWMCSRQSAVLLMISFKNPTTAWKHNVLFAALASNVLFITVLLCSCVNLDKSKITILKKCLLLEAISQHFRILTIRKKHFSPFRTIYYIHKRAACFCFFCNLFVFPTCFMIIILDAHPVNIPPCLFKW